MRDITADLQELQKVRADTEALLTKNAHLLLRNIYVPPCGPLDPSFMIVGEAPGEQEEDSGKPFCGVSGALLKTLLEKAGIPYNQCAFTNVLKVRPADSQKHLDGSKQDKKRKPTPEEVALFVNTLFREIDIFRPKVIIAAGGTPSGVFFGDLDYRITRQRGAVMTYGNRNTPVMPTYHPSYLVYRRQEEGGQEHYEMMDDLRSARRLV